VWLWLIGSSAPAEEPGNGLRAGGERFDQVPFCVPAPLIMCGLNASTVRLSLANERMRVRCAAQSARIFVERLPTADKAIERLDLLSGAVVRSSEKAVGTSAQKYKYVCRVVAFFMWKRLFF
jgi:hypothetical protein